MRASCSTGVAPNAVWAGQYNDPCVAFGCTSLHLAKLVEVGYPYLDIPLLSFFFFLVSTAQTGL